MRDCFQAFDRDLPATPLTAPVGPGIDASQSRIDLGEGVLGPLGHSPDIRGDAASRCGPARFDRGPVERRPSSGQK